MDSEACQLLDRFSLGHKVLLRLLFAGFLVVGGVAVFSQSVPWGWAYVAAVAVAQGLLVLPFLCRHCPYPSQHNDCLFLPAGIMRRLVGYGGPRISLGGKVLLLAGLIITLGFPQYWLASRPLLLALYWALALVFGAFFPLHLCRRCRHLGCPANRTGRSIREA